VAQSFAWTIQTEGTNQIKTVTDKPMQLTVYSAKSTEAGSFTVSLKNTITLASQSGFTATPTVTFLVKVNDPCVTTTFKDVTLNPVTMVLGATATATF